MSKEIEKLKKQLKEQKKQTQEYLTGWQRSKADYLNREKEIEKEKIDWVKFTNLDLILKLLPTLDAFDYSLKHIPNELKNNQWLKGIEQIKKQIDSFLKAQNIERIKTNGQKFNPDLHEAVEKQGEKNQIIKEIQVGYLLNGKVIRTAKVIIK